MQRQKEKETKKSRPKTKKASQGLSSVERVTRNAIEIVQTTDASGEKLTDSCKTIAVRTFITDPARVSVKNGLTISLDNFEFARIDVEVSIPCYVEEIDKVFEFASRWVGERIEAEAKSASESPLVGKG